MCEKCNKKIPDLNEEKRAQEKIDKYYLYFFKYLFFSFVAFFISYTLAVLIVWGGFFTENFILFLIYIAYFISLIYFIIKYHLLALIVIPLLFGAVFFYINMYVACIMIALLFTIKKIFFEDFFNKFDMIEKIKTKIKTKIEIQ